MLLMIQTPLLLLSKPQLPTVLHCLMLLQIKCLFLHQVGNHLENHITKPHNIITYLENWITLSLIWKST